QLSEMLILPPTNHCACGGSHCNTVSHSLHQCNSPAAKRAQNSSGSALASARNASSSAIDLICACSANALEGGKTRASCCSDSMLVVADDMMVLVIPKPLSMTAGLFTIEALDATTGGRSIGFEALRRKLMEWKDIAQIVYYVAGTIGVLGTLLAACLALCVYHRNSELERARWASSLYEKFYE